MRMEPCLPFSFLSLSLSGNRAVQITNSPLEERERVRGLFLNARKDLLRTYLEVFTCLGLTAKKKKKKEDVVASIALPRLFHLPAYLKNKCRNFLQ